MSDHDVQRNLQCNGVWMYRAAMQRTPWMRPGVAVTVASLGMLVATGCPKGTDDGGESADEIGDNDNGETADESGDTGNPGAFEFGAVYGAPNQDDDDGNGSRDWLQPVFPEDDDLYALDFPSELTDSFGDGESIRATISGDVDGMRVWHAGAHVLGSGAADPLLTYEFTPAGGGDSMTIEFGDFLQVGSLTLERLAADGSVTDMDTVELVSSPLIMNHHLQKAEHLWIVQTNDNAPFVQGFQAVLGDDVTLVPGGQYQQDRWIQDEIEFSYSTDPAGGRMDTVIDSIRDRGLDNFPEDYFSIPDWYVGTWGNSINATTFDAFGNLDNSPPVDGYPFGRIYYGLVGNTGLDSALAGFLDEQTLQEPFPVDSVWLCVGHVDEFSSFVPDPSSEKGFKMLLANSAAAYEIFDNADPSWGLGRYESAYGYATVGDLVGDAGMRALNEDIQANELDPLRETFKAELGLTDDDIIDIPTVFYAPDFCGGFNVALTPGTVNLIVANIEGQGDILMVPDPFARPDGVGADQDPIAQDFEARMPEGLSVAWIDDWYSYHLLDGEVHCGTNVTRTPIADWTTDGAPLLGLEGN